MFFLGLLSTPLPYLLLAAFYFFGFAMGMFNNSTGEEALEIVSVTIPVEIKQKTTDHSVYYYQVNNDKIHDQAHILKSEDKPSSFSPDTGTNIFQVRNIKVHEFRFSGFHFSRPPPLNC